MPWEQEQGQEQGQGQGPSWYVPTFSVTAKIMLCVDVEVGLYVNRRTEAEGVEGGCCGGCLASEGGSNRRLENVA